MHGRLWYVSDTKRAPCRRLAERTAETKRNVESAGRPRSPDPSRGPYNFPQIQLAL
jgi:hypothetical protein